MGVLPVELREMTLAEFFVSLDGWMAANVPENSGGKGKLSSRQVKNLTDELRRIKAEESAEVGD